MSTIRSWQRCGSCCRGTRHSTMLAFTAVQPFCPSLRLLMGKHLNEWLCSPSLAKPAREILFNVLSMLEREAAKPGPPCAEDIDTVRCLVGVSSAIPRQVKGAIATSLARVCASCEEFWLPAVSACCTALCKVDARATASSTTSGNGSGRTAPMAGFSFASSGRVGGDRATVLAQAMCARLLRRLAVLCRPSDDEAAQVTQSAACCHVCGVSCALAAGSQFAFPLYTAGAEATIPQSSCSYSVRRCHYSI